MRIEASPGVFPVALGKHRYYLEVHLLLVFCALLTIGYIMVISASMHLGDGRHPFHYPILQLLHIAIGLFVVRIVMSSSLVWIEKIGPWLFLFGLALLVVVLIPGFGVKVNGSIRWLSLGGTRIQVSEIVKLISIIYMAGYMTRHVQTIRVSA
ncbi:MAG: FtsW/RodA/SpoVE family cell cycle protein, partial [Methylococcales bacterium]